MKEIRLKLNMSEHDMEYRAKQVEKWIKDGEQVKLSLFIVGRSRYLDIDHSQPILVFYEKCQDFCKMLPISKNGWRYSTMLQRKKK